MKIGMDFPIRPEWIGDVHQLWQPAQPVSDLVAACLAQTLQELGGEKTRRNTLSIIIRNFVTVDGKGSARRTTEQDIWVAFSRKLAVSDLLPAYLVQLTAHNNVAQEVSNFIDRRWRVGDLLASGDLRQHIIARFGERKVVSNSVSAFLRTLLYFGVLEAGEKQGQYQYQRKLALNQEIFPLVVWALWSANPAPQIDLDVFESLPTLQLIESGGYEQFWQAYQPALWSLSERIGARMATLRASEQEQLVDKILSVVLE
jgi:hypothetical protein